MTEALQAPLTSSQRQGLKFSYRVAMPQPASHFFEVTLQIQGWNAAQLDLKFPVWTPGSYLVREYARHVQEFQAGSGQQALPWQKLAKNHWQVDSDGCQEVTIAYRVFANELSVRTNHLDATHGYFNGAALFFYIPGFQQQPMQVEVVPPAPDWRVTTPLSAVPGQPYTFEAADFDTLVDSPFEIGTHALYEFEVLGKPHQLAIWGEGNWVPEQILKDTQKIIQTEAALFQGLPYDRYLFLLHLSSQGNGGLEHKNACSLNYPRFGFRGDRYYRFMQLVAHEFFHLWNVKRIRPKALEVFDYEGENYTPSLWFSEGTTSYYDLILPLRAGIYDGQFYLQSLSKEITRLLTTPGRLVQPASEASFDAWIKLYRPDANSNNTQLSYYLKGELVSLLLDLLIRERHQNQRSLDDVLRHLWQEFGQPEVGFTPEQLHRVLETVAEVDLTDFLHRYVDGTEELPFNQYLEPFGLQVQPELELEALPYLGITVKSEAGREMIKFVEVGSPAQRAGIDAGDELLAIAGFRTGTEQLCDRLKDYQPGDSLQVTVFHQDELRTYNVKLDEPRPARYSVSILETVTSTQAENFQAWLGIPLSSVQ